MDRKSFITVLSVYTTILIFIFGIIFAMISRLSGKFDAYQSDFYNRITEVKSDTASLKTDMTNVKDGIKEIKETLNSYEVKVK